MTLSRYHLWQNMIASLVGHHRYFSHTDIIIPYNWNSCNMLRCGIRNKRELCWIGSWTRWRQVLTHGFLWMQFLIPDVTHRGWRITLNSAVHFPHTRWVSCKQLRNATGMFMATFVTCMIISMCLMEILMIYWARDNTGASAMKTWVFECTLLSLTLKHKISKDHIFRIYKHFFDICFNSLLTRTMIAVTCQTKMLTLFLTLTSPRNSKGILLGAFLRMIKWEWFGKYFVPITWQTIIKTI